MGLKLVILSVLLLLFLIPVSFLSNLVKERSYRQEAVRDEIIEQWGGEGRLAGPFLVINYEYSEESWNSVTRKTDISWYPNRYILLPGDYSVEGVLRVEERQRGIFSVPVYSADLSVSGDYRVADALKWLKQKGYRYLGAEVVVSLGSNRSIGTISPLTLDGQEYPFQAGGRVLELYSGEVSAPIHLSEEADLLTFSCNMTLKGGRVVTLLPVGRETRVRLRSDWSTPSFYGSFLPETRRLEADGFDAEWKISHISRNTPAAFPTGWEDGSGNQLFEGAFGVKLFQAVDHYTRNERAVKYGLLFILIPFATFFLFEIISRKRVHPFQYFLSGAASVVFYLLLLSLSEHIGFNGAYGVSASAVTAMMTFYAFTVLGERKKGILMLPIQVLSWLYLYLSLRSEDYALLIGASGLFLILLLVMILTRKIRWYQE